MYQVDNIDANLEYHVRAKAFVAGTNSFGTIDMGWGEELTRMNNNSSCFKRTNIPIPSNVPKDFKYNNRFVMAVAVGTKPMGSANAFQFPNAPTATADPIAVTDLDGANPVCPAHLA